MALAPISVPPYPDVPLASGVPPVARSPGFTVTPTPPPLAADDPSIGGATQAGTPGVQWGIVDANGKPVIVGDSFVRFEYLREYRISDYPLEKGSFESYDKVATPADARTVICQGGSQADRTAFLNACETAQNSLDLYSVVTPEKTYSSFTVDHIDYMREDKRGATLITANIWLVEVRVNATATFSNTAQPQSQDPQSGGTVQSQPPTPAQSGAAAAQGMN